MTTPSNRIDACFARLRTEKRKALIPFITAGDPDLETTAELVLAMAKAGADIIELGVPFSDPMSDGPVIQAASERALAGGTTLKRILKTVEKIRKKSDVPLLLMGYANPIYAMGYELFATTAAKAGVDAVLTVDLPPEEADPFRRLLQDNGIHPIFLLAPTSSLARSRMVKKMGSGFVYYVSLTGVTGAAISVTASLEAHVHHVRSELDLPVCVGFGIADAKSAQKVAAFADGVVVGSALVKLIAAEKSNPQKIKKAAQFIQTLRKAI